MPRHRNSEKLPQDVINKVKTGENHVFFGRMHTVLGGGLTGLRSSVLGLQLPDGKRAKIGTPIDIQYTLMDNILTRTEFLRGIPAIPIHMAHFDPDSGQRFSTIIDCY